MKSRNKVFTAISVIAFLAGFQILAQADFCDNSFFLIGQFLFTLSNETVDANVATRKCESLGGQLAVVKDHVVNDILYQKYLVKYNYSDLQRVYIFYEPQVDNTIKRYRYSTESNVSGHWKSPKDLGHLWYIDMFKKYKDGRKKVFFCSTFVKHRFSVFYEKCDDGTTHGWYNRFEFYALNSSAPGFRPVYNYASSGSDAHGNRLSDVDKPMYEFIHRREEFYLQERGLFIGVRYKTSSKSWIWIDGTEANFTTIHSTCQQKAFSYGTNGLQNKNCSGQSAYYSCQTKFSTSVTIGECDSTVVHVNISNNFQLFVQQFQLKPFIRIITKNDKNNKMETVTKSNFPILIENLQKGMPYSVQVKITFIGCSSFEFTTHHDVTTGYSTRNPPSEAFVNTSYPCVVSLNEDLEGINFTVHTVASKTESNLSANVAKILYSKSQMFVDIDKYEKGNKVYLKIRTQSCDGKTVETEVKGFCFRPQIIGASTTKPLTTEFCTGVVVGVFLFLLGTFAGFLVRKKFMNGNADKKSTKKRESHAERDVAAADAAYENAQAHYEVIPLPQNGNNKNAIDSTYETCDVHGQEKL